VSEFCRNIQLQVRQGERVLYSRRFRVLQPNRSIHLNSGWVASVDPTGEALRLVFAS